MSAVASTIFKIRAHSDYVTPGTPVLSFRKGQPFYALSADHEKGFYFVSTQFAVPFSRNAVTGLVPMDKFDRVDLFSKEVTVRRKPDNSKSNVEQQMAENGMKKRNAPMTAITQIIVLSITESEQGKQYYFKVSRGAETSVVARSRMEVETFIALIYSLVPKMKQLTGDRLFQSLIKLCETNQVIEQNVNLFFNAKCNAIYKRRDSGFSDETKQGEKAKPSNSLGAKISMFVFGH